MSDRKPGSGPAAGPLWLAGFYRPYRAFIFMAFLIGMSGILCALPQPFLIRRLIDHSIPSSDLTDLWKTVMLILALGFAGNLIGLWEGYMTAKAEKRIKVDLLSRLYGQLLTRDSAFFSLHHSGKLLSRLLVDIGCLAPMMPATITRMIRNVITSLAIIYLLFRIHSGMALAVIALTPLLLLLYHFIGKRLFRAGAHLRSSQDKLATLFQEDLRGIAITQSFGAESFKLEYARKVMEVFQEAERSVKVKESVSTSLFFLVSICSTLLLWGFGGFSATRGDLSLGSLLAFGSYIGMLTGPVGSLLNSNFGIASAMVSLKRLMEICEPDPPPMPRGKGAAASLKQSVPENVGKIVLDDLSFAYPGKAPILQGFNFEFPSGTITAITGANGSGKSTMLRLINKIEIPASGRILFDGNDVADLDPVGLRKTMALVHQEPFLFNTSIRDNLLLGRSGIPNSRLLDICGSAGVDELLSTLPGGLDFLISENGKNLSGGQRQRLHLVRALLGKPSILLLDEFTSSLDPESEMRSHEGLRELLRGKIVLLVTHNALTLRLADRVCRLGEPAGLDSAGLPEAGFGKTDSFGAHTSSVKVA